MKEDKPVRPTERLKAIIKAPSIEEQFKNVLKDNAEAFSASIIDVFSGDKHLQQCEPKEVVMEALKAATLKLPISKGLGFSYIVPYKGKPVFQIGYKGYIQLAMRTGQYRVINADVVYEGELGRTDKLTGEISLDGQRKSDKVVGYFAHIELLNGFAKTLYMSKEQVVRHAKKHSKSYSSKDSAWQTDFDAMAKKTVIRGLLSHYGYLSVEMISAVESDIVSDDQEKEKDVEQRTASIEVDDVDYEEVGEPDENPEEKSQTQMAGPGF